VARANARTLTLTAVIRPKRRPAEEKAPGLGTEVFSLAQRGEAGLRRISKGAGSEYPPPSKLVPAVERMKHARDSRVAGACRRSVGMGRGGNGLVLQNVG
jgi:hypothetical protein